MTAIWDNDDPDLVGSRLNILLCLADHANDDGVCWPSISRIAKRSRIDRNNVMDHIKKLTEAGYIKVEHRSGTSNVYKVFPKITSGGSTTSGADATPTSGGSTTTLVAAPPPKPSVNHQKESSTTTAASRPAAQDELALVAPGDSTPNSPRTEKKSRTKKVKPTVVSPVTGSQEMFSSLAGLCRVDTNVKQVRGQLNAVSKELRDAGYSAADIDKFSRWWYSQDWRGQQGKPPTVGVIPKLILQAVQWVPWTPPASSEPQKKQWNLDTMRGWHKQYFYEQWNDHIASELGINPFLPGAFAEWYEAEASIPDGELADWCDWWINRNKEDED